MRKLFIICAIMAVAIVASSGLAKADTIDVAYKYVEAGGVLDAYLGSTRYYWGTNGADGALRIDTQNASGALATQFGPNLWSACHELEQYADFAWHTYDVLPLASAISPAKAAMTRQLWGSNYDYTAQTNTPIFYGGSQGGFAAGEPANNPENIHSLAFIYAAYEILYDFDGSLGSLDSTSGTFYLGPDQNPADVAQATQDILDGLVLPGQYQGALPNLVAFTNPTYQDFVVEGVPEPATLVLLGAGALLGLLKRRRG